MLIDRILEADIVTNSARLGGEGGGGTSEHIERNRSKEKREISPFV